MVRVQDSGFRVQGLGFQHVRLLDFGLSNGIDAFLVLGFRA